MIFPLSSFSSVSVGFRFCKSNGEAPQSYQSHILRNPTTNQLICPVLRSHTCEICGATGDDAHTKAYCPLVRDPNKPVSSLHRSVLDAVELSYAEGLSRRKSQ